LLVREGIRVEVLTVDGKRQSNHRVDSSDGGGVGATGCWRPRPWV
jgi:hypothetical protein